MPGAWSEDTSLKECYKYFSCPQPERGACLHLWKSFQKLSLNRCKVFSLAKNTSFSGWSHILFGFHSLEVQSWSQGSCTSAWGYWCHLTTRTKFSLKCLECLIRNQQLFSLVKRIPVSILKSQCTTIYLPVMFHLLCNWVPVTIICAVWYSSKEVMTRISKFFGMSIRCVLHTMSKDSSISPAFWRTFKSYHQPLATPLFLCSCCAHHWGALPFTARCWSCCCKRGLTDLPYIKSHWM